MDERSQGIRSFYTIVTHVCILRGASGAHCRALGNFWQINEL